jgi:hypothetical protein
MLVVVLARVVVVVVLARVVVVVVAAAITAVEVGLTSFPLGQSHQIPIPRPTTRRPAIALRVTAG